jgi:hypothetical protein
MEAIEPRRSRSSVTSSVSVSKRTGVAEGYKPEKPPAINGFVQRVQARVAGIQHERTSSGRLFVGLTVAQW